MRSSPLASPDQTLSSRTLSGLSTQSGDGYVVTSLPNRALSPEQYAALVQLLDRRPELWWIGFAPLVQSAVTANA